MEQQYTGSPRLSREEFAALMKERREEAFGVVDAAAQAIVQDDASLKLFLSHAAQRKPTNTPNLIYLYALNPDFTQARTAAEWRERGHTIKSGEKQIVYLKGRQYEKDGQQRTGYNVTRGFDISQTFPPRRKNGPDPERSFTVEEALQILQARSNVNIQIVELTEGMDAAYLPEENTVFLRDGLEPEAALRALSRELAHAHFNWWDSEYTPEGYAAAANAAAFIAATRVGVDTTQFDFQDTCAALRDAPVEQIKEFLSNAQHGAQKTTICLDKQVEHERGGPVRSRSGQSR